MPVYDDEGIGLAAANSSAYYLGDFKIVKNNIPLGDNKWYVYNLKTNPGETEDIFTNYPEEFQEMLAAYDTCAKSVGVIEMEEGYAAESVVEKKSALKILKNNAIYILTFLLLIIGLLVTVVSNLL